MEKPVEVTTRTTNDGFGTFAASASGWLGSKWAFAGAGLIIVIWAVTGPVFHFSDTWQLVINTGTTIVTFLMVFLIQNSKSG
jgi:low affinity Fe/Cu permease